MGITLTSEEKAELESAGSLFRPLVGAEGAASTQFHNPKTGQEFTNLPIDPYHLGRHLRRGLVMGPASPELRAKWDAGGTERTATDDALMAEHMDKSTVEETPRFQDAVVAAVTQVLEKLGVEAPDAKGSGVQGETQEEETKIEYDVQLPMLVPAGAPSESETKHEVSQAPRPELHLVG